jgi:hypothetical protein
MRRFGRTAPARGLFTLLLVSTAALCVPAQAQLIYPHSAAEEKAANAVKEGLEASKKAHLEAIDKHQAYLEEAMKHERQLVTERELARRDRVLMELLDMYERDKTKGLAQLNEEVLLRVQALTGVAPQGQTIPGLKYLDLRAQMAAGARDRLERVRARLKREITLFEAAGGQGTYCGPDGRGLPAAPAKQASNPEFYSAIGVTCNRIRREVQRLSGIHSQADRPIAALLGDASSVDALPSLSPLRVALEDLAGTRTLLDTQQALAKAAAGRVKQLQALHRCEVERAAGGAGNAAAVTDAADSLNEFLSWLADWKAGATATLESPPEAKGEEGSPCANEAPRWAGGGLLTRAGINRQDLDAALKATQEFDPLRAVVAGAQEEIHEFKAARLGEVLQALADPSVEAHDSAEAAIAASLLRLYGHAERLRGARASQSGGGVSGVLVQLAAAQMRQATARIEAQRLERLSALATMRVGALIEEAGMLREANRFATTDPRSFDRALLEFSNAWTVGRIPATALKNEMINSAYIAWAARERAVVEAAYGALEPAASQLQTYGAGGIKAGEIAGYLQTLGLGAIAWGN